MPANVTLTAALRANLLSLQGTASLLDQTQLRLATGRKVNTALDNPSSFFAAQGLTNRASDMSNLLDAMGQSIQVLKAADQGITSLTSLVKQAQAVAQSAQSELSSSAYVRSGDFSAAHVANLTAAGGFTNLDAFSIQIAGSTVGTVTITTGMTLATLASNINALGGGISAVVVAGSNTSSAGSQRLEIRSTSGTVGITNVTNTPIVTRFSPGSGGTGMVAGTTSTGASPIVTATAYAASLNPPNQASLEAQYGTIMAQINSLITDAGYQGTNLLNNDTLKVQFNEKNTSSLSITGVTFNAAGLGLTSAPNSMFQTQANITSTLTQITNALSSLRSQAASFGNNLNIVQTRQDFTTNLINNLKAGADLLTLADKNEEGANLLSLQTSQQLGIQALSLASQANQSVLRLFQ